MPAPLTKDEMSYLIVKIFYLFSEYGFDALSMDEVARRIGLSKATLYKYFRSKEDIVRIMVSDHIGHLNNLQFSTGSGIDDVLECMAWAYIKAVLTVATASENFLADLQSKFPAIFTEFEDGVTAIGDRFVAFYEDAKAEGYCREINIRLFLDQAKFTLRGVITSAYIVNNHIPLPILLKDYYQLLLYQILHEDYFYKMAEENTYSFMTHLMGLLEGKL